MSSKGEAQWREPRTWRPKGNIVGGTVVEHRSHNAEIGHYVISNSYVPCVCIQADWYRPCNTNRWTTGQSPGPEGSFLLE